MLYVIAPVQRDMIVQRVSHSVEERKVGVQDGEMLIFFTANIWS